MRFLTAGESHGPELTAIIEGLPANLELSAEDINQELARRQKGYGRGGRMAIEKDQVKFMSGVRHGKTIGSPVTLVVENRDWENWQKVMSAEVVSNDIAELRRVSKPRPGHADLVGGIKYQQTDLRNILERSSARETTMRVAIGAIAKKVLQELDIEVAGHVLKIGGVAADIPDSLNVAQIKEQAQKSEVACVDYKASESMKACIDEAKEAGDTLGGVVEVVVENVPAGLGSYVQWDTKLDAKIAQAVLSINAFKGVEFGVGFEVGDLPGSKVMDEIIWDQKQGYSRSSNHLGGFEGGMTNGQPIIVRGAMKPIPTLKQPLASVNIDNHEPFTANYERSDCCAVPAACVVAEAVVATEIVQSLLEKFDSDNFETLKSSVANYRASVSNY